MKINGETLSDLQAGARLQIGEARKKLHSIQGQASRALRNLASESRATGAQWTERVRQLTAIRRQRLHKWQDRLMEAVGLASSGQVQRINRELARLSKKIDSLASGK